MYPKFAPFFDNKTSSVRVKNAFYFTTGSYLWSPLKVYNIEWRALFDRPVHAPQPGITSQHLPIIIICFLCTIMNIVYSKLGIRYRYCKDENDFTRVLVRTRQNTRDFMPKVLAHLWYLKTGGQCCGSMTIWRESGSGSADPCL